MRLALKPTILAGLIAIPTVLSGCGSVPTTQAEMDTRMNEVGPKAKKEIANMVAKDSTLKPLVDEAYGIIVFPSVASGALILGGQGGDGVVFKGGEPWGLAKLAAGSIGFQIGGESFSELVIMKDENAFNMITADKFSFTAGINATAVKAGAALDAKFSNGIAAFVSTNGGLMASAAIGGQQITCYPADVE
ncbi:lipid-binding SYLF domain-containing protein [Phycisphaerales bacterium]|nr:lipid-binding SYLF domain-containing protein [Phycisphaerales bacterium]